MIIGGSMCEVGVVYVGITSHLPTGYEELICKTTCNPEFLRIYGQLLSADGSKSISIKSACKSFCK